jgi:hypothetical protein
MPFSEPQLTSSGSPSAPLWYRLRFRWTAAAPSIPRPLIVRSSHEFEEGGRPSLGGEVSRSVYFVIVAIVSLSLTGRALRLRERWCFFRLSLFLPAPGIHRYDCDECPASREGLNRVYFVLSS